VSAQRAIAGIVAVAAVAAGGLVMPAYGAPEAPRPAAKRLAPRPVDSFTPAAADPRLAALFARSGLGDTDFRFTPAETRRSTRAVTVAVRARTQRGAAVATAATPAPTVGLAPIAYNLGVAVGWKRFAVSGDVARVDLNGQPGSREAADVAVSYSLERFTGRVKAGADRPLANVPQLDNNRSYSLDVGGSYALTRNLDVTAGMRYRSDRERLARVQDDRRDSQAVYVGTAFRF
jgi:hypothetical protein